MIVSPLSLCYLCPFCPFCPFAFKGTAKGTKGLSPQSPFLATDEQ